MRLRPSLCRQQPLTATNCSVTHSTVIEKIKFRCDLLAH